MEEYKRINEEKIKLRENKSNGEFGRKMWKEYGKIYKK
jgi:hypothetical protein